MKTKVIVIGNLSMEVSWKKIKNINIRIKPPAGKIFVSAPLGVSEQVIAEVIRSKYQWISEKQVGLRRDEGGMESLDKCDKTIVYQGEWYPTELIYTTGKNRIVFQDQAKIIIRSNGGLSSAEQENLLNNWYRSRLQLKIPVLLQHWLPIIGVELSEWRIRRMKTRWGSCNIVKRRIWLNLELAKLDPDCLEYVVVHELVHLLERRHNARFWGLVESFLPDWKDSRAKLRRWEYHM